MNRKQAIALGVLGVILLLVWGRALMGGPRAHSHESKRPSPAEPPHPAPGPSAGVPSGEQSLDDGWGESPFLADRPIPELVSPDGRPAPVRSYVLNGILWDPRVPSAVINNRVVEMGDWIGDWQVQAIEKDRVILSDGKTTRTLSSQ